MILWDDDTDTPVLPVPTCDLCRAIAAPAFPWRICWEPVRHVWGTAIPPRVVAHAAPATVCRDCARTLGVER